MYDNIFYNSLEIKADKPIDKRLYVDALDLANLQIAFESDGRYSFANSVIFNKDDKTFYYLSVRNTPADSLIPANWVAISSNTSAFVLYQNASTYTVGSCVYEIDAGLIKHFYIAKDAVAAGETPLTTPLKWLEITTGSATRQQHLHRLNPLVPSGNSTRTFDISVVPELAGLHQPTVQFFVNRGNDVNGNPAWEPIIPDYKIYVDTGTTKINVTFNGILDDIYYEADNASQMNVIAEIR